MSMRKKQAVLALPSTLLNAYRFGAPRPVAVAALLVRQAYFCVEYRLGEGQVIGFAVHCNQIGGHYVVLQEDPEPHIALLKKQALEHGATLEAIQLMGLLTPLTEEEEATMAENKKLSRKEPDKEGLKAGAKAAPVVKGRKAAPATAEAAEPKATGRKGNPEALAKAREARSSRGPDTRKITVLKKKHDAREGTKRAAMLDIVLASKTVQEALDAGATSIDVRFAKEQGLINVPDRAS